MKYQVFNDHKTCHVRLPDAGDLEEVRVLAEAYASEGHDALLRVFRYDEKSATGIYFETAFSVLDGTVQEHSSPTIPQRHW